MEQHRTIDRVAAGDPAMTVQVETLGRLPRVLSDEQVRFLDRARHSLLMRTPVFVDRQGWVIVGIKQSAADGSIEVRGVRVSDQPPRETLHP